jgi:hypothetical protein
MMFIDRPPHKPPLAGIAFLIEVGQCAQFLALVAGEDSIDQIARLAIVREQAEQRLADRLVALGSDQVSS